MHIKLIKLNNKENTARQINNRLINKNKYNKDK